MKPVMNKLKRGFTLIELMIVVAIIGLLAALAIPNFIKFQARSKQSEAKSNLKAIFTAEKSYYGDKQIFVDMLDVIGFAPERNNRYGYYAGGNAAAFEDRRTAIAAPLSGAGTNCTAMNGVAYIMADNFKFGNGLALGAGADPGPVIGAAMAAAGTAQPGGAAQVTQPGIFDAKGADVTCCTRGICDFEASATGNVDNDLAWDGWVIASQSGLAGNIGACTGAAVSTKTSWDNWSSGEPLNVCNDLIVY
jgi:type IV pilus assembly protein PilA